MRRFHMFNASRQSETASNAQTGDEELFARPFDVRMPRVRLHVVNFYFDTIVCSVLVMFLFGLVCWLDCLSVSKELPMNRC